MLLLPLLIAYPQLVVALIAILIVKYIWKRKKRAERVIELEENVARKQAEREENLVWAAKKSESVSAAEAKKIASLSFEELREGLQKGSLSASHVLATYQGLALKSHEKTNCITVFIKESVEQAASLDKKATDSSYKKPPFFGVPISIKECVTMKGYDQTRGYAGDCFKPAAYDSPLIVQLRLLGFVPFVQTNVPMSLLTYNCGNSIYGWTENPFKKGRTPGGSSGGESALIASGGSLIGIGGDVGGSIRTPAHFTGIAGFKPSHLRLSQIGCLGSVPGRPLINASDGPMAPSIHTCIELLKEVWSTEWISDHDPYVPPVTWRKQYLEPDRKYRIGYYVDDGWFTPTSGCQRVVLEAKELLESKGHTLIPFSPPNVPEGNRLFVSAVTVDGATFLLGKVENDLPPPIFLSALMPLRLPIWLQRFGGTILGYLGYWRVNTMGHAMTKSSVELRENYANIEKYRDNFIKLMQEKDIEVLLCPPMVMPAPPHEGPLHLSSGVSYTALFNMLDFGAGVVRVGEWTERDEANLSEYPTTDPWYTMVKKFSTDSVGLPLGAQIAAPPYREEAALKVLADLEDAVKEKKNRK